MSDFSIQNAQQYQDSLVQRAKDMRAELEREVINYYTDDRVDNEADAKENLRGIHRFLKDIYKRLDKILYEIEGKVDVND